MASMKRISGGHWGMPQRKGTPSPCSSPILQCKSIIFNDLR